MAREPRENSRPLLSTEVADSIRRQIAEGKLLVGSRLPPEPELAEERGVSRATLREALKTLEREGLVLRRQRLGTTILARPAVSHPLQRNGGVRELIEASGRTHAIRDAEIRFVAASQRVASALELADGHLIAVLERVRTADGTPVVLTVDHLDARVVEAASGALVPDVSFYDWLATHCSIEVTHGVADLMPVAAFGDVAQRLEVDEGTPLLKLEQRDFTAVGSPVLYSEELHVADAFSISVVRDGPFGS
jgi:GntR family transcriptional regulator